MEPIQWTVPQAGEVAVLLAGCTGDSVLYSVSL